MDRTSGMGPTFPTNPTKYMCKKTRNTDCNIRKSHRHHSIPVGKSWNSHLHSQKIKVCTVSGQAINGVSLFCLLIKDHFNWLFLRHPFLSLPSTNHITFTPYPLTSSYDCPLSSKPLPHFSLLSPFCEQSKTYVSPLMLLPFHFFSPYSLFHPFINSYSHGYRVILASNPCKMQLLSNLPPLSWSCILPQPTF